MPPKNKTKHPTNRPHKVTFRILCPTSAAGGLIGHHGTAINRIEAETSASITVDKALTPTCTDRLVHVTGPTSTTRHLRFHGDDHSVPVSPPQEGLLRVFERMLEVDPPPKGGLASCRLLVEGGLVGAVMGEGGKTINQICKETEAYVKVFRDEPLPACAGSHDEVMQITGSSLPVKKALVVVSQFLQKKTSEIFGVEGATSFRDLHSSMKMATGKGQRNNTVNERVAGQVVFKLVCPYHAAGFIIGPKGSRLKALEEETGASICFSHHEVGGDVRVATVSAFENREVQYSVAQNAVVRIFNEMFSSEERKTVTARLLIQSDESDWLNDEGVSVISAIHEATGANLHIMEDECALFGGSTDEKVLQIDGDHPSVQLALFQVSWRLRDFVLNTMVAEDNLPLLPHKLFNVPPEGNGTATLTASFNKCRVSEEVNGSLQSKFLLPDFPKRRSLKTSTGSSRNLRTAKGDSDGGSGNRSILVTNTTLEIAVHRDVFGAVYGDDGSNLARLRQISGATVEVHDPCPGSEGKVIISGTRDQTLVAQSLLQAFVMTAE